MHSILSSRDGGTHCAQLGPKCLFYIFAMDAGEPKVYSAIYSGVPVYEAIVNDVPIMRRMADDYLNATQILKVAGFPKPKRTKILEQEVLQGQHEKIQGGYGKYQGTWYV